MPIINKVSASVFDTKPKPAGRQPSPEVVAMADKIRSIKSERDVYEVLLTGEEKATTVRQQLARASKLAGVDIAVRRSPHGFYIGLMTPSRRRGRAKAQAAGEA